MVPSGRSSAWCPDITGAGDQDLLRVAPVQGQQERCRDAQGLTGTVTGAQGQCDKRLHPRGVRIWGGEEGAAFGREGRLEVILCLWVLPVSCKQGAHLPFSLLASQSPSRFMPWFWLG